MNRILLVEDDIALSNGIVMALRDEQTELVQCASLQQARECFVAHCVQLVILDVNLPDGNGLTLLKEIRETSSTPIIVLTANDTETDAASVFFGCAARNVDCIKAAIAFGVVTAFAGTARKSGHRKISFLLVMS
ncbi:response regulator [Pygmaiobacter massiliensis]|uniref:response regulator n=1 Tax=Pygmaiobacter massiliensis TaxID=1917873 RepID=UPI002896C97B|nr:response regulator [Pygmaiobacter massiliensis]